MECRPTTFLAVHLNVAPMHLYDVLAYGEAKPTSAFRTGAGLVHSVETVEYMRNVLRRNADARVTDGDQGRMVSNIGGYRYSPSFGGVAHGVVNQIQEKPSEKPLVTLHNQGILEL